LPKNTTFIDTEVARIDVVQSNGNYLIPKKNPHEEKKENLIKRYCKAAGGAAGMPESEKKKRADNYVPPQHEIDMEKHNKEKRKAVQMINSELLDCFKTDPEILIRERFKGDKDALFEYKSNLEKVKDKFNRQKYRQSTGKDDNRYQYLV